KMSGTQASELCRSDSLVRRSAVGETP
ncbi:MAG: hypothetical protein JWN79_2443, partial [Gemmatimonadetes bacterium]|nr:hypothetical protein [Gemmatimonadota bacterium]